MDRVLRIILSVPARFKIYILFANCQQAGYTYAAITLLIKRAIRSQSEAKHTHLAAF